jgi:hypothetical protein
LADNPVTEEQQELMRKIRERDEEVKRQAQEANKRQGR